MTGVRSRILHGSYVDPARPRVTVEAWAAQWLAGQVQLKASTRVRFEGTAAWPHRPEVGRVPLAKVGHEGGSCGYKPSQACVHPAAPSVGLDGLTPNLVRQTAASLAVLPG